MNKWSNSWLRGFKVLVKKWLLDQSQINFYSSLVSACLFFGDVFCPDFRDSNSCHLSPFSPRHNHSSEVIFNKGIYPSGPLDSSFSVSGAAEALISVWLLCWLHVCHPAFADHNHHISISSLTYTSHVTVHGECCLWLGTYWWQNSVWYSVEEICKATRTEM